jgi:hypothetical protein
VSAFVVTTEHVDAIIGAALHYGNDWAGVCWHWGNPSRRGKLTHENADDVGAMLFAENVRAVDHRYDDSRTEAMVPDYADAIPYTYREPKRMPTIVEALKAVRCLQYQCAEPDDYRETQAWHFLEAVTNMLVSKLPGWESAPWGIDPGGLPPLPAPAPITPTPIRRKATSCQDPAHCWDWTHACWAKRMKTHASFTAATRAAMPRATIAGREVPNSRLAA